jgi:hypothetical protein
MRRAATTGRAGNIGGLRESRKPLQVRFEATAIAGESQMTEPFVKSG